MNAFFLRVNVTVYDAVNMIHDVITITSPFPDTAKFMFFSVRNNKTQQVRCSQHTGWRNYNYLAKAKKLSILPTSLDIFDIRQHYIHILYLFFIQM